MWGSEMQKVLSSFIFIYFYEILKFSLQFSLQIRTKVASYNSAEVNLIINYTFLHTFYRKLNDLSPNYLDQQINFRQFPKIELINLTENG